ncbi:MAG TPA: FKBP-type peptidyl-prolyl cis-trans isomerase [Clostridiales bacterium]|nr:FKBP-type peptidyl-prolyl cis-trans isomerase [Clostridiales bacterium]HQP68887.1 FKBP-type peptidyl-prolyl cis-trans isomerase [Clostridiales bacterium]
MKEIKFYAVIILAAVILAGCSKSNDNEITQLTKDDLKTKAQKESYVYGIDMAKSFEKIGEGFNSDAYIQGFIDHVKKRPLLLTEIEMDVVRKNSQNEIEAAKNFMAENRKNQGVRVTRSGLQYIILEEGDGPKPTLEDKIKINYTGALVTGEEFENTFKTGNPAVFQLKGTIKGFEEGMQLMKTGSRFKFFVPPNLGYGPTERGIIKPNSVLIYEVELLEIIK